MAVLVRVMRYFVAGVLSFLNRLVTFDRSASSGVSSRCGDIAGLDFLLEHKGLKNA